MTGSTKKKKRTVYYYILLPSPSDIIKKLTIISAS